jgi:hypothetical protein
VRGGGEWLIANAAVAAQRDGEWHYPCGAWYPVPAAGIVASAEPSGCTAFCGVSRRVSQHVAVQRRRWQLELHLGSLLRGGKRPEGEGS